MNRDSARWERRRWLLLPMIALLPWAAWAGPAEFDFDQDPDQPVLTYHQVHAMLAEQDPTPLVRVYGDGRVLVHLPAVMKGAGDYETRLTQGEVRELLASMLAKGVASFDPEATKSRLGAAVRAKQAATGELHYRSDGTMTIIELRLASWGAKGAPLAKTIAWRDLPWEAKRYPEVAALGDLAAAEAELRALLERDDLQEVK